MHAQGQSVSIVFMPNPKMPGVDVLSICPSVRLSLLSLCSSTSGLFFFSISLLTRQDFGVGKMTSKSGPKDYSSFHNQSLAACYFQGLAQVTTTDPSDSLMSKGTSHSCQL